jgi:hypothetical protein
MIATLCIRVSIVWRLVLIVVFCFVVIGVIVRAIVPRNVGICFGVGIDV